MRQWTESSVPGDSDNLALSRWKDVADFIIAVIKQWLFIMCFSTYYVPICRYWKALLWLLLVFLL